jgi:competence protein ComEA
MSTERTLWEFLDTVDRRPDIIDTTDEGVEQDYFAPATAPTAVRWRVGATAGVGLVLGIVVIAVVAFLFRSQGPEPSIITPPSGESAEEIAGVPASGDVARPEEVLLIHVVGAVFAPGVVQVPAQSRVLDAINKAGGATEDALLDGVNLARVVFDGEQIVVPRIGEEIMSSPGGPGQPISLSRADSLTLQTLPRVGPATADRIIAWRETHGPFKSVEDLLAISGIGPATLEGFRDRVVP